MKFNLKYLIFAALTPLCASADDTESCLNEKGNFVRQRLSDYSTEEELPSTDTSPNNETPREPITSTSGLLPFSYARTLWHYGGKNERDRARTTLHHFLQNDSKKAFIVARHLWRLGNPEDKKMAEDYFKTICIEKKHTEYDNLVDYFKIIWLSDDHQNYEDLKSFLNENSLLKNKLGNMIFKYFA